jgi:nucleoside-diphosphate-sugar epimerase
MTVALTGATGFVGRQILAELLQRGYSVRVIVRDPQKLATPDNTSRLEIFETNDLFAEPAVRLEQMLEGCKVIIHAAWFAQPGEYLNSPINVHCLTSTLQLADAFIHAGGERFVGLGTCAEYDTRGSLVLHVDSPVQPQTIYAACKLSAFNILSHLMPAANVKFAWCRLFYLYGDGEDERRLSSYIRRQLLAGEPALLSSGQQIRDYIDVRDAARMIVNTAFGKNSGAVNICSGVPVTVREFAEKIAEAYGHADLLRFGARPDNAFDPPSVVGTPGPFSDQGG